MGPASSLDHAVAIFLTALFFLLTVGQAAHACLFAARREAATPVRALAYEAALVVHLCLSTCMAFEPWATDGTWFIGMAVARLPLEPLLWGNVAAFALGASLRRPRMALELAVLLACTPFALRFLGDLWWIALVLDAAFFLYRISSALVLDTRQARTSVSRFAMVEALDILPEGVLYADETGAIAFMNDSMRASLRSLGLPADLADTRDLWKTLRARASAGDAPNALLPEGVRIALSENEIRLFALDEVTLRTRPYQLIVALDVTEDEHLNLNIERSNRLLEKAGAELERSLDNLQETVENETLLRMKSHVHDIVGQRLSILHRYLEDGHVSPAALEDVRELLSTILDSLSSRVASNPAADLAAVADAFSLVGIDLHVEGELPEDPEAARLFVSVVREATTNAARHAQASTVSATVRETREHVELVVESDGVSLEKPVREGTGLSGMRRAAQALGGTFRFHVGPPFTLRVSVPRKEGGLRCES